MSTLDFIVTILENIEKEDSVTVLENIFMYAESAVYHYIP